MDWYVVYRSQAGNSVTPFPSREEAIDFACGLLERGVEVLRVSSRQDSVSPEELRAIARARKGTL
ncbi:MAG TPA: hypothetical protein VFA50_22835 [Stellaceae bacterium]|nr:hypothetical protein [Stellaceae bacterium]